jgi:hypothetical protein
MHETSHPQANPKNGFFDQAQLLTLGFGTTVLMWAVGYVCHIPSILVPSPIVLVLLLLCLLFGGVLSGCMTGQGWKAGMKTGLLTSLLNLLVLGSLLQSDDSGSVVPAAMLWITGSFALGAGLGALGGVLGRRFACCTVLNWSNSFAWVTAASIFCLLCIGGLVTSKDAGLAVVDWPNTFGYTMFLYPLSRMTGGIYYEHTHRLFGSLAGLTTVALAIHLSRNESCAWVKRLAWVAVILVITQGLLGGLRVTGKLTLSVSEQDMSPSTILAMTHGVLGQVFFGMIVCIAVFTQTAYRNAAPHTVRTASTDRLLSVFLVLLVIGQLVIGAAQRHLDNALLLHISVAMVVLALGLTCGVRAWGVYPQLTVLKKLGVALIVLLPLQLCFGFITLIALAMAKSNNIPHAVFDVFMATLHQATGAVILAVSLAFMLWSYRLLKPALAAQGTVEAEKP